MLLHRSIQEKLHNSFFFGAMADLPNSWGKDPWWCSVWYTTPVHESAPSPYHNEMECCATPQPLRKPFEASPWFLRFWKYTFWLCQGSDSEASCEDVCMQNQSLEHMPHFKSVRSTTVCVCCLMQHVPCCGTCASQKQTNKPVVYLYFCTSKFTCIWRSTLASNKGYCRIQPVLGVHLYPCLY